MDISGILTLFGLFIAIYAIIPREIRLDLSVKISKFDWFVVLLALLFVHYINFYPIMKEIGLSIDGAKWKYGLDEKSVTYFIFLLLGFYLFFKIRFAKITSRNVALASDLIEELLLLKKYSEVTIILRRHLSEVSKISKNISFRSSLHRKITDSENPFVDLRKNDRKYDRINYSKLKFILPLLNDKDKASDTASLILHRVITDQNYVEFLAISYPYFCLNILELEGCSTKDFLKFYIYALLDNKTSILYYELENNQFVTSNRYEINSSNKLISYFFSDARIAEKNAIYKPLGDYVLNKLKRDKEFVRNLNRPLDDYYESDRFRCPIYCSIMCFNIMITEAMHQGIKWHMWLYYFPSFIKYIIEYLSPSQDVDDSDEFPTKSHYIIYEIVQTALGWIEEYENVQDKVCLKLDNEELRHDNGSILKSAILALGNIVYTLVASPKINDKFKIYLVEIIVRALNENCHKEGYEPINRLLAKSILKDGVHNRSNEEIYKEFSHIYQQIDHTLIYEDSLIKVSLGLE